MVKEPIKRDDYERIPLHMMEAIKRYTNHRTPLGGFLRAVFANDLFAAVAKADHENLPILQIYVMYIWWECPSPCHGSYAKVDAWTNQHQARV